MKLIETISWIKTKIQIGLFPHIQQCTGDPLTDKQKRLIMTLEAVGIENHVTSPSYQCVVRCQVLTIDSNFLTSSANSLMFANSSLDGRKGDDFINWQG